jgi:nucleotidyltransferase-like protein
MSADQYLYGILQREAVDTGLFSPVRGVQGVLTPRLQEWAGNLLVSITPSGSFAKGTANRSGTDIDLFISLHSGTTASLKEIYETLHTKMSQSGYNPKRQNVSINVRVNGYDVDLVPAKRQSFIGEDHSLYRRKADTWTKTNVAQHIAHVRGAGRLNESRVLKLWRAQKGLEFPSFYLELTAIDALYGRFGGLADNVWAVFQYLRDRFQNARVMDPANTNNCISDDLTAAEKIVVSAAAGRALQGKDWGEIVR